MRFPAFACAALSAGSVHAASISIESANPDKLALVVVQGSFDANDGEQFFTKTRSLTAAMVRLQSNGGGLVAGIQIGETIRPKGLQTLCPAARVALQHARWLGWAARSGSCRAETRGGCSPPAPGPSSVRPPPGLLGAGSDRRSPRQAFRRTES